MSVTLIQENVIHEIQILDSIIPGIGTQEIVIQETRILVIGMLVIIILGMETQEVTILGITMLETGTNLH